MYKFALTVDDVAVKDFSSVEDMSRLLDFLRENCVKATFFVTPFNKNNPLNENTEWVEVLSRALAEKHELALHGYKHEPCEFGIPPDMILEYETELQIRIADEKKAIEKELSREILTGKIERGKDIFRKSFGITPKGFRSPFLAVHENLFSSLEDCGMEYDSSVAVNPKGWKYISGNFNRNIDWNKDIPCKPYRRNNGLWEVPLITEYTWFLKEKDFNRNLALAEEDMERCFARDGIFVPLSHVSPVKGENLCGYRLYETLFEHARKKAKKEGTRTVFCTLTEALSIMKERPEHP